MSFGSIALDFIRVVERPYRLFHPPRPIPHHHHHRQAHLLPRPSVFIDTLYDHHYSTL
jgi:hypothetical protein